MISDKNYWVITANNQTIIASDLPDIIIYKENRNFVNAYKVSKAWFGILDQLKKKNIRTKDLQSKIIGKTILCTYVGNRKLSEVILYPQKGLVFCAG
jgi:hypothetical protein